MLGTFIWPIYAAVLGIIFVFVSFFVIKKRRQAQVAFGLGDSLDLQVAVRTHGNFSEYVPLAILLLAGVELSQWPSWVLHALGILLVLARLAHIYGLQKKAPTAGRVLGFLFTNIIILVESVLILIRCCGL